MEEKPKARSVPLLLVGLLFGLVFGFCGGITGIAMTSTGKGGPSERIVLPTLIAAPIVGAGLALAMWFLLPRLKSRIAEWLVQLLADAAGAGVFCGVVFYVYGRMMRG